jgi:hypothetical protein
MVFKKKDIDILAAAQVRFIRLLLGITRPDET